MNTRDDSSLRVLRVLTICFCMAGLASCSRRKGAPANAGLKFDSDKFDAGIVETSAPVAHRFVIHNYENHGVQLSKITTSGPLVTAQASTMVVPAGSDASVDVTLNPREAGDASEKVTILDSTGATYQLNLRASYGPKITATATPPSINVPVDEHVIIHVKLQSTLPMPQKMQVGLQSERGLASTALGRIRHLIGQNSAGLYEFDFEVILGRNDHHSTEDKPHADWHDEVLVFFETKPRAEVRIPISFLPATLTSTPSKLIFAAGDSIPPEQIMTIRSSDVAPRFLRANSQIPWLKIAPAQEQPDPKELAIAFTPVRSPGPAGKNTVSVMVRYRGKTRTFNIDVYAEPAGQ